MKTRRKKMMAAGLLLAILVGALMTLRGMEAQMAWNVFDGRVRGTMVDGDNTVSPTRWWNWAYYAWFGWKKVAVFRVPTGIEQDGYFIGYVPQKGAARVSTQPCFSETFSVKEGHEPCTFFALDRDGREVPLELVLETRLY